MAIDRRTFLKMAAGTVTAGTVRGVPSQTPSPRTNPGALRVKYHDHRALITFLSWDTEGGGRVHRSLLREGTGIGLRLETGGVRRAAWDLPATRKLLGSGGVRYRILPAPHVELTWDMQARSGNLTLTVAARGHGVDFIGHLEMVFPFDPRVTPVAVFPGAWQEDGTLRLPAIISAPDFGQMLLSCPLASSVEGRLEGSRKDHTVDLVLRFEPPRSRKAFTFTLTPMSLAPPSGLSGGEMWKAARRGWFNMWQPSAQWGEQKRPFSAPAGILSNNVISDPASCSLWFYSDPILWTPEPAPGVSIAMLVRRSVDWWIETRTRPDGEVICYWDYGNFLDSNAGVLISAWDYVESTANTPWLQERIGRLEFIADFLARRDVDGDGMVEATQSGNQGTLVQPGRSCCWVDAVNCGHQDGYSNAVIYRAWRCLADLEDKLGRSAQEARYAGLASRLKAAYARTLFNPRTGWLGWWRSADGELHDYATPLVNSLAVEYGLVDAALGAEILSRLRARMQEAGFTRYDLGVPLTLVPIHRNDYLTPKALGLPQREDGADTFQHYQNGGVNGMIGAHFIAAHYVAGENDQADRMLNAMLARQAEGKFQNGVVNAAGKGGEWTTWDGQPCGYEGYLADMYYFLLAVVMREPALRHRLLRPVE